MTSGPPDKELTALPLAGSPASPGLSADGVGKRFGGRVALEGVTFAVPGAAVFALVGGTGAGKSVLLRVLATLIRPDRGRVRVAGYSVADDAPAVRAQVGFMPQQLAMDDRLTAEELTEFYAAVHGVPRSQRRSLAATMLEVVGLAGRGGVEVGRLTAGERRRLSLARAMVHDPQVLLLDEPTADLEAGDEERVWTLVCGLRDLGKTVVVAGRSLRGLEDVATSVGLMQQGRLVACGPPPAVRRGIETSA